MAGILVKHGFEPRGAAYVKAIAATGGRRHKTRKSRKTLRRIK